MCFHLRASWGAHWRRVPTIDVCLPCVCVWPFCFSASTHTHAPVLLWFILCALSVFCWSEHLCLWQSRPELQWIGGHNHLTLLGTLEPGFCLGTLSVIMQHGRGGWCRRADDRDAGQALVDSCELASFRRFSCLSPQESLTWLLKKWPSQFASSVPLSIAISNL